MKRLTVLFFLLTFAAHAQFSINGVIKDAATGLPLSFVTISSQGNLIMSDVDGKFTLESKANPTSFAAAYIGYTTTTVNIDPDKKYYTVLLSPKPDLKETTTINEAAALIIIHKAIARKNDNNPQKKLNTFEYKTYNKIIVTANPDSIVGRVDSIFKHGKFKKIDSSDYNFKKLITKQHLFQAEKLSEFQYNKKVFKETVQATKMAGFREPVYEVLGLNMQSFSLYGNYYELFETKYKGPLSKKSRFCYTYQLLDSTQINSRPTYVIFFKDKHSDSGLSGLLYLDRENFAVAKAVMRTKGVLDITGIHEYDFIPQEQLWFPSETIFKIKKGKSKEDIHLLGTTLNFDADETKNSKSRNRVASDHAYLLSENRFFDLEYNKPVKIKKDFIAIEIKDEAITKDDAFWEPYRKDSLDLRRPKTYIKVDSISQRSKVEKKLLFLRKLLLGYVPFGPFDLDPRYLFGFNNYEGIILGIGARTNEKVSRDFRLDGYIKYGLKDEKIKHGFGAAVRIDRHSSSWFGLSFANDNQIVGSTTFFIDKPIFKLYDERPLNVSTLYSYRNYRAYFETKIIPKTESIWQLTHSHIQPFFNYAFSANDRLYTVFDLTTAAVSVQWNPFSEYMQTPQGRLESRKHFPKFTLQFSQTVPKFIGSDFNFGKFDFRAEYEKNFLSGQKTTALFEAGYAFGDVPITHLYSMNPNNVDVSTIIGRFSLAGNNSLETLLFNEFFSKEYVYLQLKHAFKKITIAKKVKPVPVLVTRMAWGDLKNREQHIGINFNTMEKGYYESGLEINQIYSGFGLSGFYRYGPYHFSHFNDNIALRLTFSLNLGF